MAIRNPQTACFAVMATALIAGALTAGTASAQTAAPTAAPTMAATMAAAGTMSVTMSATMAAAATMAPTMAGTMSGTATTTPVAYNATCDKTTGAVSLYAAIGYDADIAKAFTAKTGIPVNLYDDSTGIVLAKISAEASNPQWDVAWFDGDVAMQTLDDQGLLLHWTAPNGANYNDLGKKVFPASSAYYPTGLTAAAVIAYNTKKVAAQNIPLPKDWSDLLDPKYKGMVAEADPSLSGPSFQNISAIATIMGGIDQAHTFFTGLKANGLKVLGTSGPVFDAVLNGDRVFGITQDSGAYSRIYSGQPVGVIYPTSGVGALPSVMGVAAKGAHQGCGELFVNYVLSAEGQSTIVSGDPAEGDRYFIPVITGTTVKVKRQVDNIKFAYIDIEAAAKNATDFKNWFRDNVSQ